MKVIKGAVKVFLLVALTFSTSTLYAAGGRIKPLTLDDAVAQVKEATGERVLSAKEVDKKDDHYYLIKTMKNGRVRLIRIDPKTGASY